MVSRFIRARIDRCARVATWLAVAAVASVSAAPPTPNPHTATSDATVDWEVNNQPGGSDQGSVNPRGAEVYQTTCAVCHEAGVQRAPAPFILSLMPPAAIYRALTQGVMRPQAAHLSDEDRRAVAEHVSGRPFGEVGALEPPVCKGAAAKFDFDDPPALRLWGLNPENTRHVARATAGVEPRDLERLRLKWAIGFEGATRVRSEPVLAGGAIYVGSEDGRVFALDRSTGCQRWAFHAGAEVRTGIVMSAWKTGDQNAKPMVFFGDLSGTAYGVDAVSGELVWRDRADLHPSTTLTAAPALHGSLVYFPVSSLEEAAADGTYDCCTFRGSMIAYDAVSGRRVWQTYFVDEPKQQGTAENGHKIFGPSGVALWNTPSIDARRGVLYVATGDNYSQPTTEMSDAVVALDLKTGRVKWVHQVLEGDAWNASCVLPDRNNCPEDEGPDYDFGAAAILAPSSSGREYLLAGQKSGWVYAFEPDDGKLVWKTKVGRGGVMAGVYFGMAAGSDRVYVPISDPPDGRTYDEPAKPGLYALELATGKFIWKAPNADSVCDDRGPACSPGIAAAVTATDDLVFTGASDGRIRIYDAATGRVLWRYDTIQDVETVSGGTARGGSMGGGAGPIVQDGLLIVPSGYGFSGRMPGNVMLVFEVDRNASATSERAQQAATSERERP
jgi:polyvinyl alcohol dehydrogenase (cytochrome)